MIVNCSSKMRGAVKQLLPPLLLRGLRHLRPSYDFFGCYRTWEAAQEASTGYDTEEILSRVGQATGAVVSGEAVAERDSVLLDEIPYQWPVLAALCRAAVANHGVLTVLDFGGALGSGFFWYRTFLEKIADLRWLVVEQPHYVDYGRQHFADSSLHFFTSIDEAVSFSDPDLFLAANVLQYLPDPHAFLVDVVRHKLPCVVLDGLLLVPTEQERITVQRVKPSIYTASYPAWLLSEETVRAPFQDHFRMLAEYTSDDIDYGRGIETKGYIFEALGS